MTNKKECFIKMVDVMLDAYESAGNAVAIEDNEYEAAMAYFAKLKEKKEEVKKPVLTENGKTILTHLQGAEVKGYLSKEIAEGTGLSGRSVAGSMRKLVNDGFVAKEDGESAKVYTITDAGKELSVEA